MSPTKLTRLYLWPARQPSQGRRVDSSALGTCRSPTGIESPSTRLVSTPRASPVAIRHRRRGGGAPPDIRIGSSVWSTPQSTSSDRFMCSTGIVPPLIAVEDVNDVSSVADFSIGRWAREAELAGNHGVAERVQTPRQPRYFLCRRARSCMHRRTAQCTWALLIAYLDGGRRVDASLSRPEAAPSPAPNKENEGGKKRRLSIASRKAIREEHLDDGGRCSSSRRT